MHAHVELTPCTVPHQMKPHQELITIVVDVKRRTYDTMVRVLAC